MEKKELEQIIEQTKVILDTEINLSNKLIKIYENKHLHLKISFHKGMRHAYTTVLNYLNKVVKE